MQYDVIIVGGGIAGLTAAAYLSHAGFNVLLCEKQKKVGGLVNSFNHKDFIFDGGIRAIENSGIVFPMLKQLGVHVEFLKNDVSIGIGKDVIRISSEESLNDYKEFLIRHFPENKGDIINIIAEIKKVMHYMEVLYGIDNPLFLDFKKDREYLVKTILPWMVKYIFTIKKIQKLNLPIDDYLKKFTQNQVLIDMIAQHFFQKTPAFFALSYFSLYLGYQYPKGGTGILADRIKEYVLENGGKILTETEICNIDIQTRKVTDICGESYCYKKLICASDMKKFYKMLNIDTISDMKLKKKAILKRDTLEDKVGGDSVFTLYLGVDIDKGYFENICSAHFFFTPLKQGISGIGYNIIKGNGGGEIVLDKDEISNWFKKYLRYTTFEISFPAMRDASLSPKGKTGMIISTLIDYSVFEYINKAGWYEEFRKAGAEEIIDTLDSTIFPGLKKMVMDHFVSTPLTIEKITGNSEGAITGWAFTNKPVPAVNQLSRIARSVTTPFPHIFQAGQWTFSPSGLPISILTGKLAADAVKKKLKK